MPARTLAPCAIAEKLSATPTRVTLDDWRPLLDLGLGPQECLEVAHIVGIFNYLTRLADGFGLEVHPAIAESARTAAQRYNYDLAIITRANAYYWDSN